MRLGRTATLILQCAAVIAVGVPVVFAGVRERRAHREQLAHLERLTQALMPVAARHPNARRVLINGSPVAFGMKTATTDVNATLDGVRAECESGDPQAMLGVELRPDDRARLPPALRLRRVERAVAGPEAGAMLCIFGSREDGGDTQVRYSLVHRSDEATSIFTVATEQHASLESLFPMTGDAPGEDIPGVPRPEGSRRDFSATFDGEAYGVRIYEAPRPMPDVVARYDAQMADAGWTRSTAVANAFPDARSYTKDDLQIVASFEQHEGATYVSIASMEPFGSQAPPEKR